MNGCRQDNPLILFLMLIMAASVPVSLLLWLLD